MYPGTGAEMTAASISEIKASLVLANRILVRHQVLDSFGHISARHPTRPDCYLLARRKAPGLVQLDDIIEFGPDGEPTEERNAEIFLERYIHAAIYAAREDVHSVVHGHSPTMVAMSVVSEPTLRAICHTCGFLGDGVPLFEIRDVLGDASNLLIGNRGLGDVLARCLHNSSVVLMRGHGFTAVGNSVPQAVYRAIYAETNARIQVATAALGPVTYLTAAEAVAAEATSALQVERTWAFWRETVGADIETD